MYLEQKFIIILIAAIVGTLLGLLGRLLKEGVSFNNLLPTSRLAVRFLIIYPITFPIVVLKNKKMFAFIIASNAHPNYKDEPKKMLKEIVKIEKQLTFSRIMKFWLRLLKRIFSDFDGYVLRNILLAKRHIEKNKQKTAMIVTPKKKNKSKLPSYSDSSGFDFFSDNIDRRNGCIV